VHAKGECRDAFAARGMYTAREECVQLQVLVAPGQVAPRAHAWHAAWTRLGPDNSSLRVGPVVDRWSSVRTCLIVWPYYQAMAAPLMVQYKCLAGDKPQATLLFEKWCQYSVTSLLEKAESILVRTPRKLAPSRLPCSLTIAKCICLGPNQPAPPKLYLHVQCCTTASCCEGSARPADCTCQSLLPFRALLLRPPRAAAASLKYFRIS
jgi:hypothetical protein